MRFDVKSAAIGFLVFSMLAVLFVPGVGDEIDSSVSRKRVEPLPDFLIVQKTERFDSNLLLESYKRLSTREETKKVSAAETKVSEVKAPPKIVIDRTIYPFFAEYDKNHQMGLAGTFFDDKAFAVIQLINFKSKQSTFHEVKEGDKFGRFTLQKLSREEVLLVTDGAERTLTMFNKRK